jgi:hypothetical protein
VRNQSRASRRSTARTRRSGFKKAQGALFVPEINKQFLASAMTGCSEYFEGTLWTLSIRFTLKRDRTACFPVRAVSPGCPLRIVPLNETQRQAV